MGLQPIVEFRSVDYAIAGNRVIDGLDLMVDPGEILVLLGESGCGKTTTLKLINRLIEPSSGEVFVDGVPTTQQNPVELRRSIGYVMQDGGLFPHMTIADNVALTMTLSDAAPREKAGRVDELLKLVALDPAKFRDRYPHELSGGQRQRVGVARSLAADPKLLLLDEPFGALDAITRTNLQMEFASLVHRLKKTAVFVTHDLYEAMRLGSRIALMEKGKIVFLDTPAEFRKSPSRSALEYLRTIGVDQLH